MNRAAKYSLLFLLVLGAWHRGVSQNVVQNPTVTQTINQPSGTELDINGIQTLLWPGLFRMANEGNGYMVLRDMSQANAWFMIFRNDGNSTGDIQFFGGFTNHGSLIPNGVGVGSIGTFTNPWGGVVASGITAGEIEKGFGSFKIDHPLDPLHKYLRHDALAQHDAPAVPTAAPQRGNQ